MLLHHDPSVKLFQHQPTTIMYEDLSEKKRRYTPDSFNYFKNSYLEFNSFVEPVISIFGYKKQNLNPFIPIPQGDVVKGVERTIVLAVINPTKKKGIEPYHDKDKKILIRRV